MTSADIKLLADALSAVSTEGQPSCCFRMKGKMALAVADAIGARIPFFDRLAFAKTVLERGPVEVHEDDDEVAAE